MKAARSWALFSSLVTLIISFFGLTLFKEEEFIPASYESDWSNLGSSFSVDMDGMGQILMFAHRISYPVIFLATWKSNYKKANNFFALMLLAQAGLMGVFVSYRMHYYFIFSGNWH